ncbi:MAG: reprolysin-like metallopeptidase, partial [Acidobacteriota bacterium]
LEPELAAQFPEIKSYRGQGVDDPSLWLRFDLTPRGFHATVTSSNDTFVILPSSAEDAAQYVVSRSADVPSSGEDLRCEVVEPEGRVAGEGRRTRITSGTNSIEAVISGPSLRTFRIAVATTQEYTNSSGFGGGTVAGTIASINTWLNGLNLIYERELAIRFVLVGSNANVIYISEPDPFTNGSTSSMINESRALLDSQIGAANYDIGHVLGAQAGGSAAGQAYLGVACWMPYKGGGATVIGQSYPLGSTSILGVIAHELGHELGASHSFNASCSGNRSAGAAWESGSGLTMMSYASQCQPDAIVSGRSLHFFSGSISEISSYMSGGGSCSASSSTGNNAPVLNAGPDFTIPRNTPFTLTATGSDADAGDQGSLTFSWEQVDAGGANYASPPYSDSGDPANSTRPIFRPFVPTNNPTRTFPSLTYILNNSNVPPATIGGLQTAENLSSISRQLNFNCIMRDGRGGTTIDAVTLTVAGAAGPFQVTQPNSGETWNSGTTQTISWNVNGTDLAPVNCSSVRISLSTNGGLTFPVVLAASTPNDGSESLMMPANQASTTARIKVEAVNNVFFDISNGNFSLVPPNSCHSVTALAQSMGSPGTPVDLSGVNFNGVSSVTFGGGAAASFSVLTNSTLRATVPAGAITGPIKVSKASCADSFSPGFTVSSTPPVTLAVDDGSFEGAYTGPGHAVNRLTPTNYPATLSSISIYFGSFTGIQVGASIDLLVGVNADGDGNINNTSFQVTNVTVQSLDQFNVYFVPNLAISSGDFVVGFRYASTSGVFPVVYDRTPPARGRSYGSGDGANFVLQDSYGSTYVGNAGIRASVYQGVQGPTCNPSRSPASANFSSAGGIGTVGVTVSTGCNWTASSNLSWVTITVGGGSGNGTAIFTVAPNSGVARSGTITVAGQSFTVRQGANFADILANAVFFEQIGKVSATGITLGCGQDAQGRPIFCPS